MKIAWHRLARQDLQHIRRYIAEDSAQAAQHVAQCIRQAVDRLADQPGIGRPGRAPDTRELVITGTPYIVAYRVVNDTIVILRVLHGSRQWPEQL